MENRSVPLEYVNSLMFELEKAFYDERGKGARFRMTTVGRKYYQDNIRPELATADIEEIVAVVKKDLVAKGIVSDVAYSRQDRLMRIQLTGCIHLAVEEQMLARHIEPFTCLPANLIALAIEEKLDRPVELAEIKVDEKGCHLLMVVFEKRPVIQ